MKKYKLVDVAAGKLRTEDRCAAMRLARSCEDMLVSVRDIYSLAGK